MPLFIMATKKKYRHKCLRCKKYWHSKKKHPESCGKCRTRVWNMPKSPKKIRFSLRIIIQDNGKPKKNIIKVSEEFYKDFEHNRKKIKKRLGLISLSQPNFLNFLSHKNSEIKNELNNFKRGSSKRLQKLILLKMKKI